jgi:hypothetical protein
MRARKIGRWGPWALLVAALVLVAHASAEAGTGVAGASGGEGTVRGARVESAKRAGSSSASPAAETAAPEPNEAAEEKTESDNSMAILAVLGVLTLCIAVTFLLVKSSLHFLPESIAIIIAAGVLGLILR